MKNKNKSKKGFTLIELLVVVSIISLLSSVLLVAFSSARSKARDARRRSDLAQIAKALELYYDQNNTYKVSGYGYQGGGEGWFGWEPGINYLKSVARGLMDAGFLSNPTVDDPDSSRWPGYIIYLCNNSQSYSISATLENPTAADISHVATVCNGSLNPPGNPNSIDAKYGKNLALP